MEFIEVKEIKTFHYKGKVHDLLIPEDNCYVINDYTVHNSGAGSLVVYLLGITKIDPIKYSLYFERFLNYKRKDPPDIDLDFGAGRPKIEAYLKEKYGQKSVAHVISFGKFGIKGALKDVFRIQVSSNKLAVDATTKLIANDEEDFDKAIALVKKTEPRSIPFLESHKKELDTAKNLVGKIRHYSLHAGGVVVTPTDLENYIPIMKVKGEIASAFAEGGDCRMITDSGLMKFDILGLKACTIIGEALKKLEGKITLEQIIENDNDPKILKCFSKGNTFSIFQFEGKHITDFVKKVKPKKFGDLVAVNALYRPAVIASGGLDRYLESKEEWSEKDEKDQFKNLLKDTYGTLCYQEQVMDTFSILGGFSLAEADEARHTLKLLFKGKDDYTDFDILMKNFKEGCHKNTRYDEKELDEILEYVKQFSQYSFNKCISGISKILIAKNKKVKVKPNKFNRSGYNTSRVLKKITIKELFEKQKSLKHIYIFDSVKKKSKIAKIKKVYKTGKKETYWVVCKSNSKYRTIRATLDHRFLTPDGWKKLSELKENDLVMIKKGHNINVGENNAMHKTRNSVWNKGKKGYKLKQRKLLIPESLSNQHRSEAAEVRLIHGHTGHKHSEKAKELNRQATLKRYSQGRFPQTDTSIHKKIFEFIKTLDRFKFEKEYSYKFYSLDIAEPNLKIAIEINGDYFHACPKFYKKDSLDTIQLNNLRRDKAKKTFLKNRGWQLIELWEHDINDNFEKCKNKIMSVLNDYQENPWGFEKILKIEKYGLEQTYDIEIDDEEHNYIADSFVVHNSHSCSYAMMGYIMMYLKYYYPAEYYSSVLANTPNAETVLDKIKVNQFRNFISKIQNISEIRIIKPNVNKSYSSDFKIVDNKLICALSKIKDVGEKAAVEIEKHQPYSSFDDFLKKVTLRVVNKRVIRALIYVGALKFPDTIETYEKKYKEKIDLNLKNFFLKQFSYLSFISKRDFLRITKEDLKLRELKTSGNSFEKQDIIVLATGYRKILSKKGEVYQYVTIYDGEDSIECFVKDDKDDVSFLEEKDCIVKAKFSCWIKTEDNPKFSLSKIKEINVDENYEYFKKENTVIRPKEKTEEVKEESNVGKIIGKAKKEKQEETTEEVSNIGKIIGKAKKEKKEEEDVKEEKKGKFVRPSWDDYFFEVVRAIAKRATCDRGRSGAVFVRENQILTTGYVGSPPGLASCDEEGHLIAKIINPDGSKTEHCTRTIHAENNAILQAARQGVSLKDAILYCTMTPCRVCALSLIRVGIKKVFAERRYQRANESEELFKQAGIELVHKYEEEVKY